MSSSLDPDSSSPKSSDSDSSLESLAYSDYDDSGVSGVYSTCYTTALNWTLFFCNGAESGYWAISAFWTACSNSSTAIGLLRLKDSGFSFY